MKQAKEHDRKWARTVLAILEQREPSPQTQEMNVGGIGGT